mgnify:CR=1 FL=1
MKAAKLDLKAARAAFFPSITLSAGVGYQAFDPRYLLSTPASLAYSATAGLVAPLVNRAAIEAQFATAKAVQIEAMYNYQKVVLDAFVEVANGLAGLEANAKLVATKAAKRHALERTIQTADALFRAGQATYFEVLMAEQSTLSAELDLIDARLRAHLTSIAIYAALGGGAH